MAWSKTDSVDISVAGDDLDTSNFTSKQFHQVLGYAQPDGASGTNIRYLVGNSTIDTGSNYANRQSFDGGTDTTGTSEAYIETNVTALDNSNEVGFQVGYIINISSEEKLMIFFGVANVAAGAATAPRRGEFISKWDNTSNQIDIVRLFNSGGAGDLGTNTNLSVLGTD